MDRELQNIFPRIFFVKKYSEFFFPKKIPPDPGPPGTGIRPFHSLPTEFFMLFLYSYKFWWGGQRIFIEKFVDGGGMDAERWKTV